MQQDVPDDVLEFIASHVKDNIRELEGALIRICAFAKLNKEPISLSQAEQVLSDLVRRASRGGSHPSSSSRPPRPVTGSPSTPSAAPAAPGPW